MIRPEGCEQLRVTIDGDVYVREGDVMVPIGLTIIPVPDATVDGIIAIAVHLARAYKAIANATGYDASVTKQ